MKQIIFSTLSGVPSNFSGGPNKVIYQIIKKIDKKKFDVHFLSKNVFHQITDSYFNEKNTASEFIQIKQKIYTKNILYRKFFSSTTYLRFFFNSSIRKIATQLNKKSWDILHSHDIRTLFDLSHKIGKIILTIHSNGSVVKDMKQLYGDRKSLKNIYQTFIEKELEALELADIITFPSEAARDMFFNDINTNKYFNKTKIIYNGIDIEKIKILEPNNNFIENWSWLKKYKYRILTVGSHIKVKNIDKILRVFHTLNYNNPNKCFLIIVGSGPATQKLKKISDQLDIKQNILFIKFLSNEEILSLMKTCNIYISLSERVVFDLVILEALACGMNVFASNDGGNKEVIDNSNGYLVDPNDFQMIANIISNSNLDTNQNAIKSVEKFSLENMVNNYSKIYEDSEN